MNNTETPERIWLNPYTAVVCNHAVTRDPRDVEYVRADLAHASFAPAGQGEAALPDLEPDSPQEIMVKLVTECLKDATVRQWMIAWLLKGAVARRLARKIVASLTPDKLDEAVEALYDDGHRAKAQRGEKVHAAIASIIEAELGENNEPK